MVDDFFRNNFFFFCRKVVKTGVVKMARMAWIVSAVEDVEKLKATMRDIVKGTHKPFIL